MRLGGKKFFYCKKNEVKCQKHDRFSITILEVSPTSSSWFSAVSPLAASVCCAVLVSCSTRPALSSRVSSACPSPCSALRSLSDLSSPSGGRSSGVLWSSASASLSSQDSEGWNRKNYMLIFHISNEVTVRMCKWGWVVRNFFIAKKNEVKCQKNDRYFNHNSGSFPYLLLLVLCCVPAAASLAPSVCCAVLVLCSTQFEDSI